MNSWDIREKLFIRGVFALAILVALTTAASLPLRAQTAPVTAAPPAPSSQLPSAGVPTTDMGSALNSIAPSSVITDPSTVGAAYELGPGDTFNVQVYPQDKYSDSGVVVSQDGTFQYPRLPDPIAASGKTVAELQQELTLKLSDFCVRPSVTISLTALRPEVVYVTGGVVNQRILDVHAASTVAKAITLAGGAVDRGMLTRVSVLRGGQVLHTNVYPVLVDGEDTPDNIALQPGDLVVVPVNTAKISVVGAVARPGSYTMAQTSNTGEGPMRLSDALNLAGGAAGQHQSRIGKIGILRQKPNDTKITTMTVDYGHYLTRGDLSQNPVLQSNDLIVVQEEHHQQLGDFTQYFSLFWIMKAVGG